MNVRITYSITESRFRRSSMPPSFNFNGWRLIGDVFSKPYRRVKNRSQSFYLKTAHSCQCGSFRPSTHKHGSIHGDLHGLAPSMLQYTWSKRSPTGSIFWNKGSVFMINITLTKCAKWILWQPHGLTRVAKLVYQPWAYPGRNKR